MTALIFPLQFVAAGGLVFSFEHATVAGKMVLFFLAIGFLWGKYKERRRKFGRNLEEYDFYPFTVTRENFGEFSLKDFRLGMHYFLKNEDYTAARQLIFIGEQSNVRAQLEPALAALDLRPPPSRPAAGEVPGPPV